MGRFMKTQTDAIYKVPAVGTKNPGMRFFRSGVPHCVLTLRGAGGGYKN
jgi:hypothetical protein